jgi:hypothetical protein
VHRRPPPAASPRPDLSVTLLTTHWGDSGDERQFVTRLMAGALTKRARVTVIHLADEHGPSGRGRDGVFEVRRVRATAGRPLRQAVLLASLSSGGAAGRLPRLAGPDLLALEGGGSEQIASAISDAEPDVLVIAGLQPSWPRAWPVMLARRPRTVIWPLIGDDALLELPGYRDVLEHADVICAIGATEHRRLSELPGLPRSPVIERLRVPIAVDQAAAGHRLPGLTRLSGYVVVLGGFPPGSLECPERPRYARLRELLPGLTVADVSHQEWRIHGQGWDRLVPYPASRTNLWRLMFHAVATVDLRPGGLIGREVIESLLLGTPVAVPVTSRSKELVEQSGGGVVFSGESELIAALRLFLDERERERVSEQGQRWAQERHGDQERFAATVARAVLGLPYP